MIAKLLSLVGKVVRVDANAMAADKAGLEAQRVPLGIHTFDDLGCVNSHTVKNHGKLVHKRNVNIPLGVLNDLDSLSGLDGGDRVSTGGNYNVVDVLNFFEGFGILSRDNLANSS